MTSKDRAVFLEGSDLSDDISIPAEDLIPISMRPRDQISLAARLANQFISQNRYVFDYFDVRPEIKYNNSKILLKFKTGIKIGAFPLLSPTTGKFHYGFIIRPRFGWDGLGPLLAETGWKIIPKPLTDLEHLPRSDRRIPAWVLSTIILFRINNLLRNLIRKFDQVKNDLLSPKGRVHWTEYISSNIVNMNFLKVPCSYSELRQDIDLRSAIHYILLIHKRSLITQRASGIVVLKLIDICNDLISKVKDAVPKTPSPNEILKWYKIPIKSDVLKDGIEAIHWTIEEKGLAGLSDLRGIPWILSMEEFFESWVETIVRKLSFRMGGQIKIGRLRETLYPINWTPPYTGSQRFLLPDVVLEREDEVFIFDAKYKEHFDEISQNRWYNVSEAIREHHRNDLLQILAYSALFENKKITLCLTYPCKKKLWDFLILKDRLSHRAEIVRGNRNIKIVLIAIPMSTNINEIVELLYNSIR